MTVGNSNSRDPYRSMPRRRTAAEKRAVRARRVGRIASARIVGWVGYFVFGGVLALMGAFWAGSAIVIDDTATLERRVEFYRDLLNKSHRHFYAINEILTSCHDRELRRMRPER